MGSNYTSKILNNATRALAVNQAVIAATGNNIANVNTPGYARRVINLETAGGSNNASSLQLGSGVQLGSLTRQVDEFLNKTVRDALSIKGSATAQNDLLSRIEPLFNLTGASNTIGSTISAFFQSINNLSVNPASIELRQDLIERGNDLSYAITNTFNTLANLQDEADRRIESEVQVINSLTTQIADLNGKISQLETGGNVAADERDQRDQILEKLSEKISFSQVESSDGSVTLFLSNGFALVSGSTSRALETTKSPSFNTGGLPPSLSGGVLNYIVYDYSGGNGTGHLDLTSFIAQGQGSVAGLLGMRGVADASQTSAFEASGTLVEVASRVEAITRQLLTSVNFSYLGPDRTGALAGHQPSSGDLNGANPAVFGLFDFTYNGTKDADGDGVPELSDLNSAGLDTYSRYLSFKVTDPRNIAAARDAGSGYPAAAVYASGDGRNMEALADLQDTNMSFAVGSYSLTSTFDQAYVETVTHVGNAKSRAQVDYEVAEDNYITAANRRDEVSGVSLDEEFSNLIKFQKSFEASARLVRTAQTILDTLVSLL